MRIFYYVHTGHRIGLDRFRRAATIIRSLGDIDITLLTSDYRIASIAKEFGIKRSVGVDVVRNIPQIAQHGDKIIFDSAELNPVLHEDMTQFFSTFIRISDDENDQKNMNELMINPYLKGENICNDIAVDNSYFGDFEKTIELAFFFGDDDYEEDLLANIDMFEGLNMELIIGFYFFLDYEQKLASTFKKQYEFEEYDEVIKHSKVLVSASPQAVLENLAAGGRPIFIQRPDYPRDFIKLFESFHVPIIDGYDRNNLIKVLDRIMLNQYLECPQTTQRVSDFIKINLT